ncbi:MAG: hypothetical protein AAF483_11010, partial [Planctomycetota bacterium]
MTHALARLMRNVWTSKQLRKGLGVIAMLSLFFSLALWATWPAAALWQQALPAGDSPIGTVPMLNAWTIWWNAYQLQNGFPSYWDAPIFAP